MIRVAAYCRVSTDQTDQVNSLAAQKRYFAEQIAREAAWELHEIYADEGISGTETKKRTEFSRMMRDALAGKFQLVLTKEVSRFSRNILDTISCTRQLKACGIGVLFMTDGINTLEADAELRLSIMASLAQEESRKTSVRVKWGQTRRMEQGIVFGHSLLGYEVKNGRLKVKEDEAELVRRIFRLYTEEGLRSGEIAVKLREEGIPKANGETDWSGRYILRILKNEKYVGDLVQKKSCTPDYLSHAKKRNLGQEKQIVLRQHHEAVVDRRLWDLTQREICRRSAGGGNAGDRAARSGFSGKIRCGECGAAFVRRQKRCSNGTILWRWSCATVVRKGADREKCGCDVGHLLRDDDVASMLRQALAALQIDRRKLAEDTVRIIKDAVESAREQEGRMAEKYRQERRRILAKKEALLDAYLEGRIEKDELQRMKQRYDAALEAMKMKGNIVKREGYTYTDIESILEALGAEVGLSSNEGDGDSAFASLLLQRLTVFGDRHVELTLQGLDSVFFFR